jgi:hypothetical protein
MENTAKNFALQLGSLVSLYISIGSLIALLLSTITVLYPDQASYMWEQESASSGIRTAIAFLVVFFPAYIVLTRTVNKVRRTESGVYLTLTKWLIYLSLLVGGAVVLGDLVAIIMSFLNGELTVRFALKALAILTVVGIAFSYYLADARGYWQAHERDSINYGVVVSFFVIATIVFGFMHTQSPAEVREINLDGNQISDLQTIQWQVQSYAALNQKLPTTLEEAFGQIDIPAAADGRDAYTYSVKDAKAFAICGTFAFDSSMYSQEYATGMYTEPFTIKNPDDWNYKAGPWCFERVLTDATVIKQ